MKHIVFIVSIILFIIIVWVEPSLIIGKYKKIEKGSKYLYYIRSEQRDPFKKIEIDTILILEKKGRFVKFENITSEYTSSINVKYLRLLTKEIK